MKKTLKIVTNKYFLTAVAFVLLFLFFDQNDWFTQRARMEDLKTTNANIEFLNGEIIRMEGDLKALNTDTGKLEKYAREKYHEKRADEDIYLIHVDTVKPQ